MKAFRYKNLFIYSNLQFSGNMEEFFVKNTEKLVVFVFTARTKEIRYNLARLYKKGKLIEENKIFSHENVVLFYTFWYINQIRLMLRYFSRNEKFTLIGGHPISFFGMWIQKILRDVTFVYMIGDYFPGGNTIYYLFQKLKEFYHKSIPYAFYLSDPVNKIMNGRLLDTQNRKTIMWGLKPKKIQRDLAKAKFTMLFVGLVKDYQGLELLFAFLRQHPEYRLNIIGVSHGDLYNKYSKMIKEFGISSQVYYPNRFFLDEELNKISSKCFVGVAPYNTGPSYGTYFVDPGKIKAYTEMGLPVIMSNTSSIAAYIKKFNAGILIQTNTESLFEAVKKISKNYSLYKSGVDKFNKHFYFETYYADKFRFLENIN